MDTLTKEIDNIEKLIVQEKLKRELVVQNIYDKKRNALHNLKLLNEHDLLLQTT